MSFPPHGVQQVKTANGNNKLGKEECIVVSRPVGTTCPSECEYLNDGCYAEKTEVRFPSARRAAETNLITEKHKIRAMLMSCEADDKSLRWHERGEFLNADGELDAEYIGNIEWACQSILDAGFKLPASWLFTHVYHERIAALGRFGIAVYASVHTAEHKTRAMAAGFKLFAWNDNRSEYTNAKPRASKQQAAWRNALPKSVSIDDTNYIVCPEMRKTYHEVTCTKTKNTKACRLCVDGKGHVLFPKH